MARLSTERHRAAVLVLATLALAAGTLWGLGASPASAADDDGSVTGSAFGFWAEVSLFGGPPNERGPEPAVELAPDASDSPQRAEVDEGAAVFGPATVFRGTEMEVHAEATLGPGGSVIASSRVQADLDAERGHPQRRPGPLYYDVLESTCTVDGSGEVTTTATVEGGTVVTSYEPETQLPEETEDVPEDPEPGYTVEGTIDHVGDRFRIVFNEQTENDDGSVTVNAAHMYLLGDIAVGDLVIGQSTCGADDQAIAAFAEGDDEAAGQDGLAADAGENGRGAPLGLVLAGALAAAAILVAVVMLLRRGKGGGGGPAADPASE